MKIIVKSLGLRLSAESLNCAVADRGEAAGGQSCGNYCGLAESKDSSPR